MENNRREQMRQARFRAFEGSEKANYDSKEDPAIKRQTLSRDSTVYSISNSEFVSLVNIMYQGGECTSEDMSRWESEGFQFYEYPAFGLKQSHGGPCGVLAVVQAELYRDLLFSSLATTTSKTLPLQFTPSQLTESLISSLSCIICRAAGKDTYRLLSFSNMASKHWARDNLSVIHCSSPQQLKAVLTDNIAQYQEKCGCLLFLGSIVLTKGIGSVREEMDDSLGKLIGQYGHCNQELINLLLTGSASSNVFDGVMSLGHSGQPGHCFLKGVAKQAEIGYLSHLEALRYLQVGSYLKMPKLPIWVLGSSSHFTTLFSLDSKVNEMTYTEQLLAVLQRSFKKLDSAECGFLPSDKLDEALRDLAQQTLCKANAFLCHILSPSSYIEKAKLRDLLQIEGDLILWGRFWVVLSQLLTNTTSLDDLVAQQNVDVNQTIPAQNSMINLTNYNESGKPRSDSEIARQLQAEWDAEDLRTLIPPSIPEISSSLWSAQSNKTTAENKNNAGNVGGASMQSSLTEELGASFEIFHFNGFRQPHQCGGSLTRLIIETKSKGIEIIGKEVPMESGADSNNGGNFNRPIEEVLRTRWPGCRVSWEGSAPSID